MALDPDDSRVQLATALTATAWALIDPHRPTLRGRVAYRTASAGAMAGVAWWAARTPEGEPLSPRVRAGAAAGAAATTLMAARPTERMDARWHGFLRRRGIRHPRLVTAAITATTYVVAEVLDRRVKQQAHENPDRGVRGLQPLGP